VVQLLNTALRSFSTFNEMTTDKLHLIKRHLMRCSVCLHTISTVSIETRTSEVESQAQSALMSPQRVGSQKTKQAVAAEKVAADSAPKPAKSAVAGIQAVTAEDTNMRECEICKKLFP
jgi:hypothetical protein